MVLKNIFLCGVNKSKHKTLQHRQDLNLDATQFILCITRRGNFEEQPTEKSRKIANKVRFSIGAKKKKTSVKAIRFDTCGKTEQKRSFFSWLRGQDLNL